MLASQTSRETNFNDNQKSFEISPFAKWSLTARQSLFKVKTRIAAVTRSDKAHIRFWKTLARLAKEKLTVSDVDKSDQD
jgi:hypothetical protein